MKLSERQLVIWFWNVMESKNNEDNSNYFGMAFCSLHGMQWLTSLLSTSFFPPVIQDLPRNPWVRIICFGKGICNRGKGRCKPLPQLTHPLSSSAFLWAAGRKAKGETCRGGYFTPALNRLTQQTMKTIATFTILASMTLTSGPTPVVGFSTPINTTELSKNQVTLLRTSGEYSYFALLGSEQADFLVYLFSLPDYFWRIQLYEHPNRVIKFSAVLKYTSNDDRTQNDGSFLRSSISSYQSSPMCNLTEPQRS